MRPARKGGSFVFREHFAVSVCAMKAAVYYETGAPEVLKYEDVAEPTLFADGLLIDVAAIAVQGGDTLNRLGGALASKPHIVGYQASLLPACVCVCV